MNDPIESLAQEFCKLTYPDGNGGCLYKWEVMSEDHKEQFRTYAKFTAKLILDVGQQKTKEKQNG